MTREFPITLQLQATSELSPTSQFRAGDSAAAGASVVLISGIAVGLVVLLTAFAIAFVVSRHRKHETTAVAETEFQSSDISTETTTWMESEVRYISEENGLHEMGTFDFGCVTFDETRYPQFFQ
jgi:hypothetical protein